MKSLCHRRSFRLASIWRFAHLLRKAPRSARGHSRCAMLFDPKHDNRLGGLEEQLRRAQAITPGLMSEVIAGACPRSAAHGRRKGQGQSADRVRRLDRCNACVGRARAAAMETSAPRLRGRRMALFPFQAATTPAWARRGCRGKSRNPSAGNSDRVASGATRRRGERGEFDGGAAGSSRGRLRSMLRQLCVTGEFPIEALDQGFPEPGLPSTRFH